MNGQLRSQVVPTGVRKTMSSQLELRHLHAAVVLAEDLNFTRAALRLQITQPALGKSCSSKNNTVSSYSFVTEKAQYDSRRRAVRLFEKLAGPLCMQNARSGWPARCIWKCPPCSDGTSA